MIKRNFKLLHVSDYLSRGVTLNDIQIYPVCEKMYTTRYAMLYQWLTTISG